SNRITKYLNMKTSIILGFFLLTIAASSTVEASFRHYRTGYLGVRNCDCATVEDTKKCCHEVSGSFRYDHGDCKGINEV
ncbi:hypothetical protein BGZ82_003967, partial [Podila clonocystis]